MKKLPSQSIDMILCDLPYGTTKNTWDSIIPFDALWSEYERVITDRGVIALTGQGIFTARLILSNPKLFRYKIVWIKSKATNFLQVKRQPLRKHEDICIFYKKQPVYHPQMSYDKPYDRGMRKDQLTGSYNAYRPSYIKSADGARYPCDVVPFDHEKNDVSTLEPAVSAVYFKTAEKEGPVYHPTQKPVALGRYLIRTYTEPGALVLDNACGSGSFLVAAALEGRRFIGIEKNEGAMMHRKYPVDFVRVSRRRTAEARKSSNG